MNQNADGGVIETLKTCDGYYEVVKSHSGKRLTPLVGYAGTYDSEGKLHYVGDVFYNFVRAERQPLVLRRFAENFARKHFSHPLHDAPKSYTFVGAPEGGIMFTAMLGAAIADCGYAVCTIFAQKQKVQSGEAGQRDTTTFILDRHEIEKGSLVIGVEDVCNNRSSAKLIKKLAEESGALFGGIVCMLNRSDQTQAEGEPIIALEHIPTVQYRQDNPAVAEDIAAGNVVWKPKPFRNWLPLIAKMKAAQAVATQGSQEAFTFPPVEPRREFQDSKVLGTGFPEARSFGAPDSD